VTPRLDVTRRRRVGVRWGLVLAVTYLLAGFLTLRLAGHHVRPLFDGFTGNLPYQWVCPPSDLKTNNVVPKTFRGSIPLDSTGSQAASPSTDDGQFLVSLVAGDFPAHPPDTSLQTTIEPLCAGQLGPPPAGYGAVGNAYRLSVTYGPSGAPVGPGTKPGNTVIRSPTAADTILYSTDGGQTWQTLTSFVSGAGAGNSSVVASFTEPGIYLDALRGGKSSTGTGKGGSSTGTAVAVGAGVVVVGGVAAAVLVLRRRRRA
jgi:hypothetical protein